MEKRGGSKAGRKAERAARNKARAWTVRKKGWRMGQAGLEGTLKGVRAGGGMARTWGVR